jgi:hypothetical protein
MVSPVSPVSLVKVCGLNPGVLCPRILGVVIVRLNIREKGRDSACDLEDSVSLAKFAKFITRTCTHTVFQPVQNTHGDLKTRYALLSSFALVGDILLRPVSVISVVGTEATMTLSCLTHL